MKMKIKKVMLILSAFVVVCTSFIQPLEVSASFNYNDTAPDWLVDFLNSLENHVLDSPNRFEQYKEYVKNKIARDEAMVFGALGAYNNNDGWLKGALLGGLLNRHAEFYNQPNKVYDYINGMYKDYPSQQPTNEPYYYSYEGTADNSLNASNNNFIDNPSYDYSTTNRYQSFVDNSDYSTHSYNYQWYNPMTNNYNECDTFYYDTTSNSYYYETSVGQVNYNNYVIDNGTHITYYIVQNDTQANTEFEFVYDIYYKLPDGRNSYDLRKDDVWGKYFVYNVMTYDSVAEDDGKTLGLWHFDGNTNDSSFWNNRSGIGSNIDYVESKFDKGKYFGGTSSSDLTLYLDECWFVPTDAYTLEWIEYHGTPVSTDNYARYILPSRRYFDFKDMRETYVHFALVFNGSAYNLFVNGVKQSLSNYTYTGTVIPSNKISYLDVESLCGFNISDSSIKILSAPISYIEWDFDNSVSKALSHYNSVIDEMRLSRGALYTDNYVPSAEPFTTNTVLVIPDDAKKGDIVIHSNYKVSDFRIGGAKPTFPSSNYVYVALDDNDIVTSVQQYQVNEWVEVSGRVYLGNDKTEDLVGYDMATFKLSEPSDEDNGSGDNSNDDNSNSGNSDNGFDLSGLGDGIVSLVNSISNVIGSALSSIGDLLESILNSLSVFTEFSSSFSLFLGQAFSFIPQEIWSIFGAGLSLLVLVGIIKMFRG